MHLLWGEFVHRNPAVHFLAPLPVQSGFLFIYFFLRWRLSLVEFKLKTLLFLPPMPGSVLIFVFCFSKQVSFCSFVAILEHSVD